MADWRPFKKHLERPLLVLDTETTGLPKDPWAHVVDLGAVLLTYKGEVVDTFEAMTCPPVLDARADVALKINNLTHAEVLAAPPHEVVVERFMIWMAHHGMPFVTSFNVDFDREMVERMGPRMANMPWAPCIMKTSMAFMGPAGKLRDAHPRHPRFNPKIPWLFPKLVHAAEFFEVPVCGPAHRALPDAQTAAGIWNAIRARALQQIKEQSA